MSTPVARPSAARSSAARSDLDLSQPFTRDEAYSSGLTDRDLRWRDIVRVFRGVYVHADAVRTLALRARAALKIAPSTAMVSHHTAALLWGGTVPSQSHVHITVPSPDNCQVTGIRTHRFLE